MNNKLKLATIDLANSLIKLAAKSALGPVGEVAGPVSDLLSKSLKDVFDQRRARHILEECVDVVAKQLVRSLESQGEQIPEGELSALVFAAQKVFDTAQLDIPAVIASKLDSTVLRHGMYQSIEKQRRIAALGENEYLFDQLVEECLEYLVQVVVTLPGFTNQALIALIKRPAISETLEAGLLDIARAKGSDALETRLLRAVSSLDRMQLFGLSGVRRELRSYPLSVAYVSLSG